MYKPFQTVTRLELLHAEIHYRFARHNIYYTDAIQRKKYNTEIINSHVSETITKSLLNNRLTFIKKAPKTADLEILKQPLC